MTFHFIESLLSPLLMKWEQKFFLYVDVLFVVKIWGGVLAWWTVNILVTSRSSWNVIQLGIFKSGIHVPGWILPKRFAFGQLMLLNCARGKIEQCCIKSRPAMKSGFIGLHLTHSALVVFLFSKSCSSRILCWESCCAFHCPPAVGASWPFGFSERCFIIKFPGIFHSFYELWALCAVFVLWVVLHSYLSWLCVL